MSFWLKLCVFLLVTWSVGTHSQSDVFSQTRQLLQTEKWDKLSPLLDQEILKSTGQDKELLIFQKAYSLYKINEHEKSAVLFEELNKKDHVLAEYVQFYLGQIYLKLMKWPEATESFNSILAKKPNLRLKNEVQLALSNIHTQQKQFSKAHDYLVKVEKGSRGTEDYPDVLFELAKLEDELGHKQKKCERLRQLYSKFPQFEKISSWNYELKENSFNGKKSECSWDMDDFKTRIRNSLWAGLEKKSFQEIIDLKKNTKKEDLFEVDKILAVFYAQVGDLEKSYEILKAYLKEKQDDNEFLTQIAPVAARAGDLNTSISLYYKVYQNLGNTAKGLQALFQAAFMSYQSRDYDWSGRNFKKFIKKSKDEKLIKESQWYLAWMKYLRGDYQLAYSEFKKLSKIKNKKKYKSLSQERLAYWMGMSQLRVGQEEKAKQLFEKLSKDKKKGYYSVAANKRLEKMKEKVVEPANILTKASDGLAHQTSLSFRSSQDIRLVASLKEIPSEDSEQIEVGDTEEEADPLAMDSDQEQVVVTQEPPFKAPDLIANFERSRALMVVGLDQWSKWELYEIERRTKNKEYLKVLMNEYALNGQFHRMSQISQIFFSDQKHKLGLEAGRSLWESSFPKAYQSWVDQYSKEFSVAKELVWSIMKAESQYKKEAISPVGALGLMQVMPYTGARVAEILGDKSFSPNQLLNPETAIRIGTKYLQRLNKKFNSVLPLVAASYNAGPHRVKNWIQQFGGLETDEFIEHIPFLETRNYVKKVIANSYIYARLYRDRRIESQEDIVPYLAEKIPYSLKDRAPTKETWEEI